jgi:hypothetical protein
MQEHFDPRVLARTLSLAALAAAASLSPTSAGDSSVFVFLGQKSIDLDVGTGLEDVEEQPALGVGLSLGGKTWPVALAVDLLFSSGQDAVGYTYDFPAPYGTLAGTLDFEVDTREINLGARKFWREGKGASPYVGGGAALVDLDGRRVARAVVGSSSVSATLLDDEDSDVGYWVDAGVLWRRGHFDFGVDLRYSEASAALRDELGFETTRDSGGFLAGAVLGYRWGP